MGEFTGSFDYVYAVSSDGSNTLGANTVADTPLDITGSDPDLSANDRFDVSGSDGPLDGTYRFVSQATAPGGEAGFIAKDSNGHSFFFANAAVATTGQPLTLESGSVPICFLAGTRIRTPDGESAIEALSIGALVTTTCGRAVPVRWIGRQTMVRRFTDPTHLPIHLRAHALADNVPARDLFVSPNHALLIDDLLVQAGCLVNGTSVLKAPAPSETFVYYHVELDDHSLILAENTPAETFLDAVDRERFDNWAEHEQLYGSQTSMAELPHPRVKATRQVPRTLRARLEARGIALYGLVAQAA